MKRLSVFLLFIINVYLSFALPVGIILNINDTITVKINDRRIEIIDIDIDVFNNTNEPIFINKQIGVVENVPTMEMDKTLGNFCYENYDGRYLFYLFDKLNTPLCENSLLSVGDFVYFTKKGSLKYVYLEGVDNPRKIKRELGKFAEECSIPSVIKIEPNERIKFITKIYLGAFLFESKQTYYITLVYNNKTKGVLSDVCLKSNSLVLKVL